MGVMSRRVVPACGNLCCVCPSLRASSRQPVKRYKKLLAEIFPRNQVAEPNDRKIGKLCDYASKNPLRIPKITDNSYTSTSLENNVGNRWNRELPDAASVPARELYISRHTDLHQFKFRDPFVRTVHFDGRASKPFNHLILHHNNVYFSQGSDAGMIIFDNHQDSVAVHKMTGHNARITCMRLFSLAEQNVLVTSSCDRTIQLWSKGSNLRSLKGHNGPVLSLSNKLLGEDGSKVLASGGEDGTVRLWSLSTNGKRVKSALKATLYGHEKPVNFLSVSGHKTSLLVTISTDSKVRVWDTTTSSSGRSSCVGTTNVRGATVNMQCHESLVYVAAGSSVTAIDLRTMQKVITAAVHQSKLYSFGMVPSKSLIGTGGDGRAMLWDIRKNQEPLKPVPIAELDGHSGPVTRLHMDSYKIVTGGPDDAYVNVWEVETGVQTNSFLCFDEEDIGGSFCDDMVVDGCRIVTASNYNDDWGVFSFRDFDKATIPVIKLENEPSSKFWGSQSDSDSDSDE